MPDLNDATRALLDAVSFAARAHQGQSRKDGRTPVYLDDVSQKAPPQKRT